MTHSFLSVVIGLNCILACIIGFVQAQFNPSCSIRLTKPIENSIVEFTGHTVGSVTLQFEITPPLTFEVSQVC